MPGPQTSTLPAQNQSVCAGDLISHMRDFKRGRIEVQVPAGKTAILSGINLGGSVATLTIYYP